MTFNYTKESLNNIKKNQLVELVLHLQSYTTKTINKLTGAIQKINGEIQKINENFSKYEADITITKNVNMLLSNQLNETGKQCWANAQYSCRECIEIVGIPSTADKENLKSKVCEFFYKIEVTVTENDIEACHRLNGDKTIAKFCKHKMCQNVFHKKGSLKKVKQSDVGLSGETPLFINESLCSYYKGLWNKCKELWNEKLLYPYFTINGNVKYTLREGGKVYTVTHKNDFKKKFPNAY